MESQKGQHVINMYQTLTKTNIHKTPFSYCGITLLLIRADSNKHLSANDIYSYYKQMVTFTMTRMQKNIMQWTLHTINKLLIFILIFHLWEIEDNSRCTSCSITGIGSVKMMVIFSGELSHLCSYVIVWWTRWTLSSTQKLILLFDEVTVSWKCKVAQV